MGLRRTLSRVFNTKNKHKKKHKEDPYLSEMRSVDKGLEAYKNHLANPSGSSPLLRRNTHRLEKGLCYPNAKTSFAENYIRETVNAFEKAIKNKSFNIEEIKWAEDVIRQYFKKVSLESPKILEAYNQFKNIDLPSSISTPEKVPYSFLNNPSQSNIDSHEFLKLCKARVSCRWFQERKVDYTLIEHAVQCASEAASACNRQPFFYCLIENNDLKKQIVNLPFGTAGFGEQLPHLIMVVGDLSHFSLARDRHLIYIDSCLATSQLMLSLTTLNLASVPINWPDVADNHNQARQLLNLEDYHIPIMLLGFGYPLDEAQIPYSQKKEPNTLIKVYE